MGCADSKVEATGEERKVAQAESMLRLSSIDVEKAFDLLRRYSNEDEITRTQLARIIAGLRLAPLRPFLPFFQVSGDKYSLSKLATLFFLLSSSPQASKQRVFLLLWDTNCEGLLTQDSISGAAELILAISIDFAFSLVKDSSVAFGQYKQLLLRKRQHSMARQEIENKLNGLKELRVSSKAKELIGEALDAENVRKIVKNLEIPDSDRKKSTQLEVVPTKSSQNTLSSGEIARRQLLREELKPKLEKGPFQ